MSREWKPGDVASVSVEGQRYVAVCQRSREDLAPSFPLTWAIGGCDHLLSTWVGNSILAGDPRPLVVIDPEDREQAERLAQSFANHSGVREGFRVQADEIMNMQDTLREFANPKPPKPAVTVEMVKAMQQQVRMDREQSAYWQGRELDHGGLSAVDAWLGSLADWLGADDA